jgi:hypothetical protein
MSDANINSYFTQNGIRPPDQIVISTHLDPVVRAAESIDHPLAGYEVGSYAWFDAGDIDTPMEVFYVGQSSSLPHDLDKLWGDDSTFDTYFDERWERGELFLPLVAVWFDPAPDEWELMSKLEPELNMRYPPLRYRDSLSTAEILLINEFGREDPKLPGLTLLIRWRMENGFYEPLYVDAIVQHGPAKYDLFQTHAFMDFWAAIGAGAVLVAKLHCQTKATSNLEEDFRSLGKELTNNAIFKLTGDAYDPSLAWNKPLWFSQTTLGPKEQKEYGVEIPPYYAPLSIGYIEHDQSRIRIGQNLVLARWPSGSKTILLIHRTNPELWNPGNSNKRGDILAGWTPPVVK